MPLPKPNPKESQADFVSRFMQEAPGEFKNNKQRMAVAYSTYRAYRKTMEKLHKIRFT